MGGPRVCRVRPDLPAVDRLFDYEVPPDLLPVVRTGTIVRVELGARRVRGWITALDVEPETEVLRPLRRVSSAGPPASVVELCDWIAWRWSGPPAIVLRAASPANAVPPGTEGEERPGPRFTTELIVSPPAADRRELVVSRLAAPGSTIVVVPDAGRSATFARELRALGHAVAELGTGQRDADRSRGWAIAAAGGCVVVGGRSAVLAPVPDLASMVVLDEGDEAMKETRAPTWNARDVALERARRNQVPMAVLTPAPTLEALESSPVPRRPDRGAARSGWAQIEVIDPGDEAPGRQLVTDRLTASIGATISDDRRAVCVLNRKGRARLLICDACGAVARCERCGAAVIEATDEHEGHPGTALRCERCDLRRPSICAECNSTVLRARRLGVSRVRDALAGVFPGVRVDEIDAASERDAGVVDDAPIVVGTEAALHRVRSPVGLVAFLEFDQELLATRYRASEQALWLLVRASRLVGGRRGRVVVQTRVPDHEVVRAARAADPAIVSASERERRSQLRFPPYGGLAELSGAETAVEAATNILRGAGIDVLGSEGARALVRARSPEVLADQLAAVDLAEARAHGRLRVEVEPLRV